MKGLLTLVLAIAIFAGGYYYYTHHKAKVDTAIKNASDTKNTIIATTTAGIDSAIKSAIGSIAPLSLVYYAKDRNYGESATKNICNDTTSAGSIGGIISGIQVYTKSISCVVDTNYPSKSFTIVASSFAHKGEYYCTDQNGKVELIPSVSSGNTFKAGFSCK
jgi:hypothetical protein